MTATLHRATPQGSAAELVMLLEQQRATYRRLRQLAERQRVLVVQDDMQPLLALLGERQGLVDELMRVHGQLKPYRADWPATMQGLDEPTRKRVTEMLEEANEALSGILQRDNRDSATLTTRRQETSERISALGQTTRATAAYAAARRAGPGGPARFGTDASA